MAGRQVMGWSAAASSGDIRRVPLGPGSPVCCLEQEEEGQLLQLLLQSWEFSSHILNGEKVAALQEVFSCSLHLSVSLYPLCIPEALVGAAETGPVSRKFILNDHYCCCADIICASQGTGMQMGSKILC